MVNPNKRLLARGGRPTRPPRESITCPVCWRTSHHPEDVRQGYCGACRAFTTPRGGAL